MNYIEKKFIKYIIVSVFSLTCFTLDNPSKLRAESVEKSCRIVLHPARPDRVRRYLAKQSMRNGIFVCPFRDQENPIIYEVICGRPTMNLGREDVAAISHKSFVDEITNCSPALSGIDRRIGRKPFGMSYVLLNTMAKFDQGKVDKITSGASRSLKQAIIGTGAPVSYINSLSTVICLNFSETPNWDLNRLLKEGDISLPSQVHAIATKKTCPQYLEDNFHSTFQTPVD